MVRAGTLSPTGVAIHPIYTLFGVAVGGLPKVLDAREVATKIGRYGIDDVAAAEVVVPRIGRCAAVIESRCRGRGWWSGGLGNDRGRRRGWSRCGRGCRSYGWSRRRSRTDDRRAGTGRRQNRLISGAARRNDDCREGSREKQTKRANHNPAHRSFPFTASVWAVAACASASTPYLPCESRRASLSIWHDLSDEQRRQPPIWLDVWGGE